jgi:hypothetical protein
MPAGWTVLLPIVILIVAGGTEGGFDDTLISCGEMAAGSRIAHHQDAHETGILKAGVSGTHAQMPPWSVVLSAIFIKHQGHAVLLSKNDVQSLAGPPTLIYRPSNVISTPAG